MVALRAVDVRAARRDDRGRATTRCGSSCTRSPSCSTRCPRSRGSAGGRCSSRRRELRWVRTQLLGRAPGFSPGPPVVGPYRPVTLVTGPRVGARLRAWLEGTTGVVEVDGRGTARVPRRRAVVAAHPRHAAAPRRDGRRRGGGRVGFRTIENRSEDSLDLWVNGVRVFCRGAVWTPGDLAALDEAVGLGLNLVRVPGIAAYESDAFHDRCDELGLLVWQDLMFATFDYPLADEGFVETVSAEVEDQCRRLLATRRRLWSAARPSTSSRRRCSASARRPGTPASSPRCSKPLVQRSGLDAVWVDSSPSGGDPVIRVDTGIAQYFGVGAYLRDLPDARHSQVRFAAECLAFSNLTDPVVPGGVPRDSGADWDFADVREHYLRAAVRRGRDRGRRAAGHGRGDGRRLRGVAPPGLGLRRRHRALAARRRPRRRLGAARPRGPAEAGRPGPRADPAADRGLVRGRGAQRSRPARRQRRARAPRGHAHGRAAARGRLAGRSRPRSSSPSRRTGTTWPGSRRCSAGSPT